MKLREFLSTVKEDTPEVADYDRGEYDREGDMAHTQLHTICSAAQELMDMIEPEDNLPEWVQSKLTLAQDYMTTVRDYLASKKMPGGEMTEGLGDESIRHEYKSADGRTFRCIDQDEGDRTVTYYEINGKMVDLNTWVNEWNSGKNEPSFMDVSGTLHTKGVWKHTSLNLTQAQKQFGNSNARVYGENRLGQPAIEVRVAK